MASRPAHGTIILKEGYLIKRSASNKLVTNWRRRYFRLQPGELLYFESPQEVTPRRRIPLGLDSNVTLANELGINLCFTIKPTPTGENFYVQAATESEKKAWVDAIFEVIRKAKDVSNQSDNANSRPTLQRRMSRVPVMSEHVLLNVRVVAAKGLIAADTRGTSDSYCVITLVDKGGHLIKETQKQTKTMDNDLDPVWNFDTTFGDKIDLTLVDEIRFDLYDHDVYTKDECIGTVSVPMGYFKMSVASATSSETIDHWFQIAPPPKGSRPTAHVLSFGQNEKILNERDHGELHLIMNLSGEKLPGFFRSLERSHHSPKKDMITNNFDETDNRLEVTVISARGLIYIDPKDINHQPLQAINPMCEIQVLDIHKRMLTGEQYKTGVQFRTVTPTFPDAHFVCGRHSQIEQAGYLKIIVLHAERGDRIVPIGSVTIDLNEVSAYKLTKWYALECAQTKEESKPHVGDVQVELCLIGESRGEKLQRDATKRAIMSSAHAKTIEQTELENAQFQMLLAERNLDGAKITCAEQGYQVRHPNFYGVNGYLHAAHLQLVQANKRHQTPDHVFQNRGSIEGYAQLDIAVVGVNNLQVAERVNNAGPATYAKLEVEPGAAIISSKKISKPYLIRKTKQSKSPTHRVLQHSEDQDELNGGMMRQAIYGKKPLTADVSSARQRLGKNEQRNEKVMEMRPDRPYLKVRVLSGHNLMAGDMNGYSDPYCTLFLTDPHDVPYKKEKKKTAVVSKTLNPVWQDEEFTLGYEIDLNEAKTLLLHIKDHNNIGRATPLGRVEVPLHSLCQGSATTTSIQTVSMTKRYPLVPEPWMKQDKVDLGEICLETEMMGNATVLANLLMRQNQLASGLLSFHSSHSITSGDTNAPSEVGVMEEEETIYTPGQHIRTSATTGSDPQWPGDRFQLQLAYPALLGDNVSTVQYQNQGFEYDVRIKVICGRNLINCDRNSEADPFFTIYPVWPSGEVVHAAKKQSLTVYESRNPVWPHKEFIFGKDFNVTKISHLAIHFYDRDWGDFDMSGLKCLGNPEEIDNSVWLPRHLLHKITHSGDIDRSGALDVLEYDQKILAFRKCGAGGNYFAARVKHYTPFPVDTYLVVFEDELNSIGIVKKLLSYDAKGEIMHVRGDGTVDIQLLGEKKSYVSRVPIRLLTPVKEFTATMDTILAKKKTSQSSSVQPRHAKWSRVELQILSLSEMRIPEGANAGIIVTVLSHPEDTEFTHNELGEIVDPSGAPTLTGAVNGKKKANINNSAKLWTYVVPTASGTSIASKAPVVLESNLLEAAAAFIIRIVDQGKDAEPTMDRVLGMAKLDIQTLDQNEPNQHLKVFPDKTMKFDTFYGVVHARTQCTPRPVDDDVIETQGNADGQVIDCKKGLQEWYLDMLRKETETPLISLRNLLDPGNHVELSYIARRQALRGALSARQNRQVDNLGYALNTIYRHLLGVLRELELFDEYESLSHDDQRKFSAVHTVSANPDSEWLYRRINDLTVHVRKNIVVELEMQLLSLAGCKAKDLPPIPAQDATLEQWLEARASRYAILDPIGDFLPRERGFLLKYSACFTGSGIISWILRMPNVLWKDGWVDFAANESIDSDSKLGWDDPELLNNTEAIQAPEGREHTLVWLKALFDAGFIESVSDKRDFADKEDRYYRLHGLEHERLHQRLKDSTFPLDLVREVDCQTKSIGELFCKRLTDHAAGFLGTQSHVSTLIGTAHSTVETLTNMKVPHLTLPNVSASLNLPSDLLWDWKYCIFVPGSKHDRKYIYMYDSVHATNASVVIDLSGTQTIVTYSNANLVGTDCFEIRHPVFLTPHPDTNKLVKMTEAEIDDAFKCDVSQHIVLKAQDSQVWMQAMLLAGVKVTLEKKQKVLFQRLNSTVLQAKCIKQNVPFSSNDLEGSFQHLMNAIFGHDKATKQSSDKKVKELRSRLRNELKKAGNEKEPVTAKYGRSGVFDPPPTDAKKFTKGHEYAARICSVKTPFTEASYPFKQLYKIDKAPPRMVELLKKYKVTSRMAWLELPKNIRDIFLLYDVEYHHKSEIIIEKDLLREDFHTMDGDLDPLKVHDKCLDLNVIFKPHDLEGCVSLFTEYANGETPMGCFRIQLQALSEQRELDWWFKLTPERGMIQRRDLGSIRVRIEMRKHEKTTQLGSLALPPPVAQVVERAAVAIAHKPHEDSWFNKRKKSAANTPSKLKAPVRSILHIDILEGRKLIVADIKTSDPFVQLYLVGTKNGRDEEIACGKTDIIPNTLNPKWKNQGFTLGKSEETRLDDKKALILRVFDHDSLSSNDPMGCVKLEFEKDALGYIRRLKLHHSGPNGKEMPTWVALNESGFAEVFERLMRDTKAGQMAWAKARGNTEEDGVLGRLRFRINLTHNDFNDTPHDVMALGNGSPVKPTQFQLAAGPTALTRYGLEITLNAVVLEDKTKKSKDYNPDFATLLEALSWAFVPKTKDGHCVSYDLNAEQMTHDSKKAILEHKGEALVLGSTYDITRVATYEIVLTNTDKGCSFVGSLAVRTDLAETTIDIECLNRDPKDKIKKIIVSVAASFIGLNRASYVQRVLTETYLYSGLEFDSKNIQTLGETAEDFLWETCHAAVCPGQNVSDLLFDQLYKLSLSTRLHWERTPKLLFFILHHSMSSGKDRLPYRHTVPLDNVLQRWSAILSFIAEARAQLTGRLHGEFTPRLIANLATLCDWSGEKDNTVTTVVRDIPRIMQALHVGQHVQARVSTRCTILPGSLVDVSLGDKFFAGRVAQLWSDGYADIIFANNIGNSTPLLPEELPPIAVDVTVFVLGDGNPSQLWENYRRATVVEIKDGKEFRVVFDKCTEESWLQREQIVLRENRVALDKVHPVLAACDFVRVVHDQTSRTARIVLAKGNATYDVQFIDGSGDAIANIRRDDIVPAPNAVVSGVVTAVTKNENDQVAPLYDILLHNATVVAGVNRNSIRLEEEHLCTEQLYVCSTYLNDLGVGPVNNAVETLRKLWRDTSVIQAYFELPKPISSVAVRDSLYGSKTTLTPRNNTTPQFVGQYHGYVLGPQWSDLDKTKVANIRGLKPKDLPVRNLLSFIVAPVPFVGISGVVILQGSENLGFKTALEQWQSLKLSTEMQRLISSWVRNAVPLQTDPTPVTIVSISSHLNGKPVKDVKLDDKGVLEVTYMSTGKTLKNVSPENLQLQVHFQVKVALAAASTLSEALTMTLDTSKTICDALHMHSLIAATSQPKALWSSDSEILMEVATEMVVRLQVTSPQLKDAPVAEIAMEPLLDIRLVVTAEDKSEHDVVLSIQHLHNECQLRHELLPRFAATVVERKESDKTCVVRFRDTKENTSIVSLSDVHLDTLNIEVLKAHDLHTTISNRKGSIGDYLDEDIQVRVYMSTMDIPSNSGGKNKLGLTVNADGAIVKDLQGYDSSGNTELLRSTHVIGHKPSVDWDSAKKVKKFKFGQPTIPLDYVSKLVFEVFSSGYNQLSNQGQYTSANATGCIGYATIDLEAIAKHEVEQTLPLYRKGHPEDREPRGNITVRFHRDQDVQAESNVLVRRSSSSDKWTLCPNALILRTLRYKTKHAERGMLDKLAAEVLANKPLEQEREVQKLFHLMQLARVTEALKDKPVSVIKVQSHAQEAQQRAPPVVFSQIQVQDVVAAGLATAEAVVDLVTSKSTSTKRKKWSADYVDENPAESEHVIKDTRSHFEIATDRLRATLMKLHHICTNKLIPQLDAMAVLSQAPTVNIQDAEKILNFFEDEVDELDKDDAYAFELLEKRTRVAKLTQLLSHLLRAYLRISVLVDHDSKSPSKGSSDELLGVAIIPLLELLDQREHNRQYQLHLDHKSRDGLERYVKKSLVHVKLKMTFSEVSLLETAITILKECKRQYIDAFEVSRRRVNAAVVPAQRRRWQTLMGYLETLKAQSTGKMHWETTPTLLEHVWDIFLSHRRQFPTSLIAFAPQIQLYREAVVKVHTKWVNLQPKLEELLKIQSLPSIDAKRTPDLLAEVEAQVEGLDILRRNAWLQVQDKWVSLKGVLDELVEMKENNKLHMGKAPVLLKFVSDKCFKGLQGKYADAVAEVQFRWIALTKHDGPINELRLMDTHGLHWRRTYDLLRLLDEQCEGFSDVDDKALKAVKSRWDQVESWLNDFLEMQQSQKIHCQQTPYALRKFLLIRDHLMVKTKDSSIKHDEEQVEGMLEWYAHEESKRELIRLPYHRITTDEERDKWLQFSENGRDSRLLITKQDMLMNAENVRAALIDRGIIPRSMPVYEINRIHDATGHWPKVVLEEIEMLEALVEKNVTLDNPERIVELYEVLEDIGKGDLLWKIKHCVNQNKELSVPDNLNDLLFECHRRAIATTELETLLKGLATTLQKEELQRRNIAVPVNASYEKVCSILVANQVNEIPLPTKITEVQDALAIRGLDKKGDAQFRHGVRINTIALGGLGNNHLGIVDTHIETLRKQLLMEAMRKRNSLIKTFPVPSKILEDEASDIVELDMSGDHIVLVDRFHKWLVHEAYMIKLASYAAMDRCARALVEANRDQIMTKEDMAIALKKLHLRLPPAAFTRDELLVAAKEGKINQPTEKVLNQCPSGDNAKAMAYYAAIRTCAMAFQQRVPFTARVDVGPRLVDSMPPEVSQEVLSSTALPQDRSKLSLGYVVADWLLGNDDTPVSLRSAKSRHYLQRLQWVSAAFTIRDRWWQLGFGWCDRSTDIGVGVKVLLDDLILMSGENKMHMVNAERLLKEVNEKCFALRPRENDALESILFRYNENMGYLEELVQHAERCINNRKLHSERTPELLHLIQQHCVVPKGLSSRHQEAYRVVTTYWLPHSRQLEELVQMHKEGTFSIHRTPEILEEMAHHTEGLAGSKEAHRPVGESENNDAYAESQLNEWRKGQRKSLINELQPGLSIDVPEQVPISTDDTTWKTLSTDGTKKRADVSPFKRSVTWSFGDKPKAEESEARPATEADHPILQLHLKPSALKKSKTLSEEVCTLLTSPTKWLTASCIQEPPKAEPRIPARFYFPAALTHDEDA